MGLVGGFLGLAYRSVSAVFGRAWSVYCCGPDRKMPRYRLWPAFAWEQVKLVSSRGNRGWLQHLMDPQSSWTDSESMTDRQATPDSSGTSACTLRMNAQVKQREFIKTNTQSTPMNRGLN